MAALGPQGAPAAERLRPSPLDLDDHLAAVAGSRWPVPEQERLNLGGRFVSVQRHMPRGVGVSRHQQVRADAHNGYGCARLAEKEWHLP